MAFINYIAEKMIPPDDRVSDQDNILRIHGVHSRTMRLHYDLYKQLMYSKGPLTRIQREMIAVVVSSENGCRYWLHHHGAGLRRLLEVKGVKLFDIEKLLAALASDYRETGLPAADLAMLDYAVKLTRSPGAMTAADVDALRAQEFDDRAIHDICAIAAYYAFVNRIADGLGVELESRNA
jgi:uncharacterized peroxidase-related enzyme